MDKTARHISYGVLVFYIDRNNIKNFLLLKSNDNFWGFPKGHAEHGEDPKSAAVRELKEETGIDVNHEDLVKPVQYWYEQPIKGVIQRKTAVLYPLQTYKQKILLQESEIKDHKWTTIEEAIELINLPEATRMLLDL